MTRFISLVICIIILLLGVLYIRKKEDDVYDDYHQQKVWIAASIMIVVALFACSLIVVLSSEIKVNITSSMNSTATATEYHFKESELIFDSNTNIVYIKIGNSVTPYLSENGNFCRYINDEIVEINGSRNEE